MCHALGEVPDVTEVELLNLIFSVLINGRDENGPRVDEAPFGYTMPMQLANSAFG